MLPDPAAMDSAAQVAAETRSRNRRLEERLDEAVKDRTSLERLVHEKNSRILSLEAENVRLKMQRTDKENASLVDGLRKEVGARDRKLVELQRLVERNAENEKIILVRATAAEQRVATLQNTLQTMQAARDAAEARERETKDAVDERVEEQNALRVEAVRKMVDAVSKRESLEKRILDLLGVVSGVSRILPLLPQGLVKSSKDVQSLLAALKKVDVKA